METRPQSFGRVLLFGDSQIALDFGRGLENWLRTQDEATETSRIGMSGWGTEQLLNGKPDDARGGARSLNPRDYDTIVLSFGGNDLWGRGDPVTVATAAASRSGDVLAELIRFLKSGGATIVFLPTLPFPDASASVASNPKRAEYRALQAPIARNAGADIIIDLAEVTEETGYVTDAFDGIHLTQQSGENIAQILWSGDYGGRRM
jgi:lysophospholipase L1-like esterase